MSLLEDLAVIVRRVTGDYRFERTYAATVERADDDAVDVMPDDSSIAGNGLQRIPMPTIDPTTRLAPEPGCRCLLAFREGKPSQPYIAAWEYAPNSATVMLDGGSAPIARKGDLIELILSAATPIAGSAGGTVIIPGTPPTPVIVPPAPFTATATIAAPVYATPIGGAPKVKA